MSNIPVGSPPAPPGRHAAPGGWYPDPVDPGQERYWDGWQWSRNTRPRSGVTSAPSGYGVPGPGGTGAGTIGSGGHAAGGSASGGYGVTPGYGAAPGQPPMATTAPTTADGVRLAGWWWRALAVVIDAVIVGLLTLVPTAPIYLRVFRRMLDYLATVPAGTVPDPDAITSLLTQQEQTLVATAQIAVALVFHVAFLRWKGATPGKLLVGLRVVPVDRGRAAGPLPWDTVLLRVALWVVPGVLTFLLLFQLVDVLFPLWHPKRQALHDLVARTQVVAIR